MSKKCKLVIVMRTDLGMTTGKMIAQAGHAIVGCLNKQQPTDILREWKETGMKKVTLQVDSEVELLQILTKAQLQNVVYHLVSDAGLTQNEPGTNTCIAIGPDTEQQMKKITGALKLFP